MFFGNSFGEPGKGLGPARSANMKILQWSMTIPKEKQAGFIKWFKETAGPTLGKFGAKKHELYKVEDKQVVGRQFIEKDRFIERIYFDDKFNIQSYFETVRQDPQAWEISREYEEKFGATNIELRVLNSPGN